MKDAIHKSIYFNEFQKQTLDINLNTVVRMMDNHNNVGGERDVKIYYLKTTVIS